MAIREVRTIRPVNLTAGDITAFQFVVAELHAMETMLKVRIDHCQTEKLPGAMHFDIVRFTRLA